ncbi:MULTISPECIES: O-antigen ligase family protein [unclassified Bradyrhizobium]|uniref:O-antigen ligase family protein n=1 Tax=unclassified Bradyrhizobium TaxID=2631580 RepID=UPI00247A22A0|nr:MULTISPECIES: O-antigen ligase family protein [unclassified Bradyrhizobium]WGS17343.1 O-antigen ligase family protein [Bradyrhizobium sp. ISRA463]WGS31080.1 O-antigen ligase family protein [Bradyrhizobium sp. ISRA464]
MSAIILAVVGLLLLLTRIIGVRQMMLTVMLLRPSCDRAFDWVKAGLGQQSGPGAAINALVIVLAMIAIAQVPNAVLSAPLLGWASLLLAAAISLFHTTDLSAGTRDVLDLATYGAAFTLPYLVVRSRTTAAQCLTVALGSSLIPSVYALLELARQPASLTGPQRLQSTFTHPNIYAFYIVGVLALILYMHCSTNFRISAFLRRATFCYALYLLFLLLLTKTRSAWLAALLLITGYSIVVDRRWLLPVLILPMALLIPGVSERLADLESGAIDGTYEHLNSMAWREVLWNDTLEWLAANPSGLFGYGLGSYQSYFPLFFPRGDGQEGIGPHNAVLQIYFEMGIVGLCSFAVLMAAIAFRLFSTIDRDFAGSFTMLMLWIGYLMVFYSDNLLDYLQFQWFFWFTMGTVCASKRFAGAALQSRPLFS